MSEKILKKRRWILFLSVLVVAIVVMVYLIWRLGANETVTTKTGLNTQLPGGRGTKDSAMDKMAFYMSAKADSVKRMEQMQMDPYRKDSALKNPDYAISLPKYEQPDITAKIAAIQQRMGVSKVSQSQPVYASPKQVSVAPDPEIEAINGTLDKLLALKHPESVSKNTASKQFSLSVSAGGEVDTSFFGKRRIIGKQSGFYNGCVANNSPLNTIPAVVPQEQIVVDGGIVKLELKAAIEVGGVLIPAGSSVSGIASLDGSRLLIHISTIHYQLQLLPVSLVVYDLDGLEGFNVPGSIGRDVAKVSAENVIQSTGISGYDMSLKTQAAAAGIGAAKSLLSKKVKQVKVTLTAGYPVLLREKN